MKNQELKEKILDAVFTPLAQSPREKLWTAIARCQVCKKELNRAKHVPEGDKMRVAVSAPLVAICDVPGHSTLSDCNIGVELEWVEENQISLAGNGSEE